MFYLLFFLLMLFAWIYYNIKHISKSQELYTIFVFFLLFVIISGGRHEVGADWNPYKSIFQNYTLDDNYIHPSTDFLFYGINRAVATFSDSFNVFVFILFFVSFLLKYKYIIKESSNVFFSLIVYLSGILLIFDVNGLRQGLAFSFVLLGSKYIRERIFFMYLLLMSCAIFSHNSAAVFLPAYFLINYQFSYKQYIAYSIALSLVAYCISYSVGDLLAYFVNDQSLLNKYDYYASGETYAAKVSFFSLSTFRRFFLWGLIVYLTRNSREKFVFFMKNSLLVSFFFYFLFSSSLEIAYRMSYYYFCFEIFLIPLCISSISDIKRKNILFFFLSMYYFYMIYKLISNPNGGLYIYNNIFI